MVALRLQTNLSQKAETLYRLFMRCSKYAQPKGVPSFEPLLNGGEGRKLVGGVLLLFLARGPTYTLDDRVESEKQSQKSHTQKKVVAQLCLCVHRTLRPLQRVALPEAPAQRASNGGPSTGREEGWGKA